MGKRIFLFGILTFLIVSCTNNNDETVLPKRVTSVKYIALIYDDITLSNYYNPSSGKISFEYDNLNRINKVIGGLVLAGSLTNFYELTLGDEAQDNISYENNVIKVECSYNTDYRPYNKEFVVQNDKIISRSVVNINPYSTPAIVFTYEYLNNTVIEKKDGNSFRTFTITNGNLTNVEQINYGYVKIENVWVGNQIIGKKEYVFSDYDNTENLLKGKFYINGAFFNAFSNNNYRKMVINYYAFVNNQYVLNDYSTLDFNFGYDSNNISNLFEYKN